MGPIWGQQDPGGLLVGPMQFAIWGPPPHGVLWLIRNQISIVSHIPFSIQTMSPIHILHANKELVYSVTVPITFYEVSLITTKLEGYKTYVLIRFSWNISTISCQIIKRRIWRKSFPNCFYCEALCMNHCHHAFKYSNKWHHCMSIRLRYWRMECWLTCF